MVPDRISFNSVISACNVQSAWHAGLNLLAEMKTAFIKPNEAWKYLVLLVSDMLKRWVGCMHVGVSLQSFLPYACVLVCLWYHCMVGKASDLCWHVLISQILSNIFLFDIFWSTSFCKCPTLRMIPVYTEILGGVQSKKLLRLWHNLQKIPRTRQDLADTQRLLPGQGAFVSRVLSHVCP